jgi:hypothetical protein
MMMTKKTKYRFKKKQKAKSVRQLKKIAWHYFSRYIRLRDADRDGYVRCYTCGVRLPYQQAHAGHFIGGRHNAILFDERGVHPQCYACNVRMHGNTLAYFDRMRDEYGDAVVRELRALDKTNKQFTAKELTQFIIDTKSKLANIHVP